MLSFARGIFLLKEKRQLKVFFGFANARKISISDDCSSNSNISIFTKFAIFSFFFLQQLNLVIF